MAITGAIPIGRMPVDYLNQGTSAVNDILNKARAAAIQQRQIEEMAKYHKGDLDLRRQAGNRAAQQMDPMFKVNQIKAMIEGLRALHKGQQGQGQDQGNGMPPSQGGMQLGQGQGMPNMPPMAPDNSDNPMVTAEGPGPIDTGSPFVARQGYKAPQQMKQPQQPQQDQQHEDPMNEEILPGITLEDITRHALGLPARKMPANGVVREPPDVKRANDLKSKMDEEKYKHELKQEDERTAAKLKNEQERHKVIESAKNDLPHLNETLRSLQIMKKIADDPANDDMFGHWVIGDTAASNRSTNPNTGIWQTHGLGPIINAEMQMSSRGNQLALKSALANKPNFEKHRTVVAAQLKASIDKIERQIKQTSKIANEGKKNNEDFSKMSDEELKAIAEGK